MCCSRKKIQTLFHHFQVAGLMRVNSVAFVSDQTRKENKKSDDESEDEDDPAKLQKKRDWDEWKDGELVLWNLDWICNLMFSVLCLAKNHLPSYLNVLSCLLSNFWIFLLDHRRGWGNRENMGWVHNSTGIPCNCLSHCSDCHMCVTVSYTKELSTEADIPTR